MQINNIVIVQVRSVVTYFCVPVYVDAALGWGMFLRPPTYPAPHGSMI